MSNKITKKQLEKIIKEEVGKILSEALNPGDAVKYLRGVSTGASGLKGNMADAVAAITTAVKLGGDDLTTFYKNVEILKAAASKLDDVNPNKTALANLIKSVETAGRASTKAAAKAKLLARVRDLKGPVAQADAALDDIANSADEVAASIDDISGPGAASDLSKQIDNSSGSPQMKKTTKAAIAAALTTAGAVSLALLFSTNPVEPADAEPTVVPPNNSGTSRETRKQRRIRVAHNTIKASSPKESVRKFQQILIDLGYSVGNLGADGDYGGGTVSGVKDFQRKNNLKPDGYVGTNTYKILTTTLDRNPDASSVGGAGNTATGADRVEELIISADDAKYVAQSVVRRLGRDLNDKVNILTGEKVVQATLGDRLKWNYPVRIGKRQSKIAVSLMVEQIRELYEKGTLSVMGSVNLDTKAAIDRALDQLAVNKRGRRQRPRMQRENNLTFEKWSKLWK